MKKKKQVVAADLSSDREEEKREDNAEVEDYQMSSVDEDKGVKSMILVSEKLHVCVVHLSYITCASTLLYGEHSSNTVILVLDNFLHFKNFRLLDTHTDAN